MYCAEQLILKRIIPCFYIMHFQELSLSAVDSQTNFLWSTVQLKDVAVVSHSIGRKLRLVSSKGAKDICRDGVNRFHLRLPRAGILLAGIVQQ